MPKRELESEKNMHAGHRDRLLDLVYECGLDKVSKVQQMEFILFYLFPRGDTNPLAHRLLDKFENVSNSMNASLSELTSIYGIGPRTAKYLKLMPEAYHLYSSELLGDRIDLTKFYSMCDYCEDLVRTNNTEALYIIALTARGKVIRKSRLARGSFNYVTISAEAVASFIFSTKPAFVIMVHNHPGGLARASEGDLTGHKRMRHLVNVHDCILADHLIIGENGIYSLNKMRYYRSYVIDGQNIKKTSVFSK